jgi:hypothetical protein
MYESLMDVLECMPLLRSISVNFSKFYLVKSDPYHPGPTVRSIVSILRQAAFSRYGV